MRCQRADARFYFAQHSKWFVILTTTMMTNAPAFCQVEVSSKGQQKKEKESLKPFSIGIKKKTSLRGRHLQSSKKQQDVYVTFKEK